MTKPSPFRYFRTSPEIIRLAVMMYVRFPLSLRNVEDLLHERGIDICHETVRFWWNRFGPMFAAEIRKRRVEGMLSSRWRWHLDEVFVKINGERHYLWRAVDHEGEVLESFVTKRRDRKAALKFIRKSLKRHGHVQAVVTDRLRSYGAALRELGISDKAGDRPLGEQSSGEFAPTVSKTGTGDAPLPADPNIADVRIRPRLGLQSLQSGTQPNFSRKFQAHRAAALAEWRQLCAA